MFRRIFITLLLCLFMAPLILSVTADEVVSDYLDILVIQDRERNDRIEELFEIRGKLELDYANNIDEINHIDLMLEQLGVEEVSSAEVMTKLGTYSPDYDVSSTEYVRWTSRRLVVTFNGQHYELQILEAIACHENSPLLDSLAMVSYEADGVEVGIQNAAKVVAAKAWGMALDGFGDYLISTGNPYLTLGVCLYDAISFSKDVSDAFKEAMSTSTVLDKVEGTASVMMSTRMRYIFVKPYQTQDYGNQLLSYIGNAVTYGITIITNCWEFTDNDVVLHRYTTDLDGTSYSPYYDDFSVPARIHYNYKYNGIKDFNDRFFIREMTFRLFDEDLVVDVKNVGLHSGSIHGGA